MFLPGQEGEQSCQNHENSECQACVSKSACTLHKKDQERDAVWFPGWNDTHGLRAGGAGGCVKTIDDVFTVTTLDVFNRIKMLFADHNVIDSIHSKKISKILSASPQRIQHDLRPLHLTLRSCGMFRVFGSVVCLSSKCAQNAQLDGSSLEPIREDWEPISLDNIRTGRQFLAYLEALILNFGPMPLNHPRIRGLASTLFPIAVLTTSGFEDHICERDGFAVVNNRLCLPRQQWLTERSRYISINGMWKEQLPAEANAEIIAHCKLKWRHWCDHDSLEVDCVASNIENEAIEHHRQVSMLTTDKSLSANDLIVDQNSVQCTTKSRAKARIRLPQKSLGEVVVDERKQPRCPEPVCSAPFCAQCCETYGQEFTSRC